MSNVEFEVDKMQYGTKPQASSGYVNAGATSIQGNEPKMIRWLMKKGIVKSPAAGQTILVVLIIINFVITYAVITYLS